ncbi:hypothetical protein DFS34DRAFT_590032 [Phlyctochytrium arcticum]|nr:hypothetical protein DFS34DRAFT_590032 [Phlyctochytrium arcticum]
MSSVMRAIEERARALIAQHGNAAAAIDAQVQQQQQGSATDRRASELIAQHGAAQGGSAGSMAETGPAPGQRAIAQPRRPLGQPRRIIPPLRQRARPAPLLPLGLRPFQDTDIGSPTRLNVGHQDKVCPICDAHVCDKESTGRANGLNL